MSKKRRRIKLSEEDLALLWDCWKQGYSASEIGRKLDCHAPSVLRIVAPRGGIAPAERHRSRLALTLREREEISRGLVAGLSVRRIAAGLGRAASTISREIGRNGGYEGYRASQADEAAWERARRPKVCKLARNRELAEVVAEKLRLQWSPQQIAGWSKREFAWDEGYQVSHETIYRSLFIQARGALKRELIEELRRPRSMRRSRHSTHHTHRGEAHSRIRDAISISERPASVEDRAVPGHWEGDLLLGSKHSQIATLVERQTRYVMLVKVASKESETVVSALIEQARKLPQELLRSLTWDRGTELAAHLRFTLATDAQVYFCDPHKPWQRGTNENTNGLLRQYFPKGAELSQYSQAELDAVAQRLNERPRKTLNFETPAERLAKCVASTH